MSYVQEGTAFNLPALLESPLLDKLLKYSLRSSNHQRTIQCASRQCMFLFVCEFSYLRSPALLAVLRQIYTHF
eukprot:6184735-Pleurochrysis_carterae.AAC.3